MVFHVDALYLRGVSLGDTVLAKGHYSFRAIFKYTAEASRNPEMYLEPCQTSMKKLL